MWSLLIGVFLRRPRLVLRCIVGGLMLMVPVHLVEFVVFVPRMWVGVPIGPPWLLGLFLLNRISQLYVYFDCIHLLFYKQRSLRDGFWFLWYFAFFGGYGYVVVAYYSVFPIICVDGNCVGGIVNNCSVCYDRP